MKTSAYLRDCMAVQQCRARRRSGCRGLRRTYGSEEHAAPCDAAQHLLPLGTGSALLVSVAGGRAKPHPAPAWQTRVIAAISSPQPEGCEAAFAHQHCHTPQHGQHPHCTLPGLSPGRMLRGWVHFWDPLLIINTSHQSILDLSLIRPWEPEQTFHKHQVWISPEDPKGSQHHHHHKHHVIYAI